MSKYLLGFDIGSSSVKAALVEITTGKTAAHAFSPDAEMSISSTKPGWTEHDPESWWRAAVNAATKPQDQRLFKPGEVAANGICYHTQDLFLAARELPVLGHFCNWC